MNASSSAPRAFALCLVGIALGTLTAACSGTPAVTGAAVLHPASNAAPPRDVRLGPYQICHIPSPSSPQSMLPPTSWVHSDSNSPSGLEPADIQAAYNLPSATRGNGQLVAIVEVCDNPNLATDLATFRSTFGMPPAQLTKFNQRGEQKNYPNPSVEGALAIDVDAEMVSATCPNCAIDVIEARNENATDFQTAEATAIRLGAHIITNSWGCGFEKCLDKQYFNRPGTTYVDMGTFTGSGPLIWPAAFADDVAVGATYLRKGGHLKRGWLEKVFPHYGGGCATSEPKPPWQHDAWCAGRSSNDVSIVGWNVATYDSFHMQGWGRTGGTGVAQGLIAGIYGLAQNAGKRHGGSAFWDHSHLKDLNQVICRSECLDGRYSYADGWGSPNGIGAF